MSNSTLFSPKTFAITVFALSLLSACTSSQNADETKRLARVGNEYLTLEQARHQIPEFMMQEDSVGALLAYRETWIENRLMLQEAERLQLRQDDQVQSKIVQAQQEVLTQALKDAVISDYEEELVVTD
ncbi:MAG: hypothetical protein R3345_10995, partial [Fulvivirga sp.]|nr:hypothetical protein [Fulvivirga sp.]